MTKHDVQPYHSSKCFDLLEVQPREYLVGTTAINPWPIFEGARWKKTTIVPADRPGHVRVTHHFEISAAKAESS